MAIKRAKIITKEQFSFLLQKVKTSPHPLRDEVALRLSYGAGLRGGEIARLRWWNNVLDAQGNVSHEIRITSDVGKRSVERVVPLSEATRNALIRLRKARPEDIYVFYALTAQGAPRVPLTDSRGRPLKDKKTGQVLMQVDPAWEGDVTPNAAVQWFRRFFQEAKFDGCTSHSGRRTFITDLARTCNKHGGSLKDVQLLAGHKRLETTGDYIEPSAQHRALVSSR